MNKPDTEIIPGGYCPKCKEPIKESTDWYCRYCWEPLIKLHTRCGHCSFSSIAAMTGGEPRYCPMCGYDWPTATGKRP